MILYGASPRRGTVLAGLPAPRPDMGKRIICEALPHAPTVRELYMGFHPMPHLGIFFGKKIPKNPKKPNCIGFKPSNTDSEQGCRRQPCFFARRRQHGTATAPTPRAPAVPPAPAARCAAPHSPVVHPTLTVVPSVIAPSPCTSRAHIAHTRRTVRAYRPRRPFSRRTDRTRSSPRGVSETAGF